MPRRSSAPFSATRIANGPLVTIRLRCIFNDVTNAADPTGLRLMQLLMCNEAMKSSTPEVEINGFRNAPSHSKAQRIKTIPKLS